MLAAELSLLTPFPEAMHKPKMYSGISLVHHLSVMGIQMMIIPIVPMDVSSR